MLEEAVLDASSVVAYDVEQDIGSNNWVIDGTRSESGFPMMANDPHRAQGSPSLRYWVHLVGPGWNVIGGGEPSLQGYRLDTTNTGPGADCLFDGCRGPLCL